MIRVAFSGSRKRSARQHIQQILSEYDPESTIIVHGWCPEGIDAEVREIADKLGFKQRIFYPKRPESKYYLERNKKIAEFADILYAFPRGKKTAEKTLKGIVTRGGTEHTIRQFVKLNKPVILC